MGNNYLDNLVRPLGYKTYYHYLNSAHWKNFRKEYRNSDNPQKCVECGSSNFTLHHKSYENLGKETFDDVIPLCRFCHNKTHGHDKAFFKKGEKKQSPSNFCDDWDVPDEEYIDKQIREINRINKARRRQENDKYQESIGYKVSEFGPSKEALKQAWEDFGPIWQKHLNRKAKRKRYKRNKAARENPKDDFAP
jgi:hypothetical protein